MKKRIVRYLKHLFVTLIFFLVAGFTIIVSIGGSIHYGDNPLMRNLDKEGPYVFFDQDSLLNVNYIRGNKDDGFYVKEETYPLKASPEMTCFFPLDSSHFKFPLSTNIASPDPIHQDDQAILAISDIESGYRTFRDFLINNRVIDQNLNWIFGKGHLVLLGDFVDRGNSTTQVLWFIYKLEQDAKKHGGMVHYIIGNHELYNLQGKYKSAAPKYNGVAAILGKQTHDLYSPSSFIGRWLTSKNTLEWINGNLFAHGGIHPDVADLSLNIEEINEVIRKDYYHPFYPKTEMSPQQLLCSHKKGIAWYRGYFKDDLTFNQIEKILKKFDAKTIVVGHTLQSEVNQIFDGGVTAIDVKHPNDYQRNFPKGESEGLLILGNEYFRVLHTGEKIPL